MAFYDREDKPALISFFTFPFPTVAEFKKHEEYQYLNACETILHRGVCKPDRTGTGTLSQFGTVFRFSLRNKIIPLLTTKRVFWKGIVHELFWMLQGKTHIRWLQEKGVHIWDANGTRAFLDQRGLSHYEEGDLGPVYGFQWRHFGAEYKGHAHDYTNQGVDQIAQIIHTLRTNPHDRRMILSAWNPLALQQMALPPCHMTAQFYVAHNRLSCCLYQRSADMGLGVPFNIASYALLTHIIAHCALMEADELVHVMGDTHIYQNHVPMIREQLKRSPRPFPTINISNISVDINDMRAEDVELLNYDPHPSISMPMAV
jgi:thymidylate synthase